MFSCCRTQLATTATSSLRNALTTSNVDELLATLSKQKQENHYETTESCNVDLLRSVCFLRKQDPPQARQSLLERLRIDPNDENALQLLRHVNQLASPVTRLPTAFHKIDPLFAMAYKGIRDYTMLTPLRLFSLFLNVKAVCESNTPGDIVECGTAGGGSAVLMAIAVQHFSKIPRRVFACDTFRGMPPPNDAKDRTQHAAASLSNWGAGTCSSGGELPVQHLAELFSVQVTTVPGLFADTLPSLPTKEIAVLHADGDWYESTRDILVHLEPRVVSNGGVIQIDDYGYWSGCKEAVEEYFPVSKLHPVDGIAVCYRK